MKRDAKQFRERFKRWQQGESYWDMRAEAERKTMDLREQYDYVGYLNKYGTINPTDTETGHYTDEFKLPGHPTFSDESIYSNQNTRGGHWNGNKFEHSDWTMKHSDETNEYLKFADPNVVATYKGGIVLPEITIRSNKNSTNRYMDEHPLEYYTPSDKIKSHIAKWEYTDFDKQNKDFNGDAIGAKAQEFNKIMRGYYGGYNQGSLDGLFSTYYNLKPKTFKNHIMPLVKKYSLDRDKQSWDALQNTLRNRYKLSNKEHQNGIKRRAKADTDLMYNSYDESKYDYSLEEPAKISTIVPIAVKQYFNNGTYDFPWHVTISNRKD